MKSMFVGAALILASAPGLAQAPDSAPVVTVQLSNIDFTPKRIMLEHGRSYVLHLVSSVDGGHNFDAEKFFASARVDPADRDKVREGVVEVPGHAAVDVRLTAPAVGTYKLRCSHFGHALLGMKGKIVVQ